MNGEIQEGLRKQLLEINISIIMMQKANKPFNDSEYQNLRHQKSKIIKALKKELLADAQELIGQSWLDIEEGRMKL